MGSSARAAVRATTSTRRARPTEDSAPASQYSLPPPERRPRQPGTQAGLFGLAVIGTYVLIGPVIKQVMFAQNSVGLGVVPSYSAASPQGSIKSTETRSGERLPSQMTRKRAVSVVLHEPFQGG